MHGLGVDDGWDIEGVRINPIQEPDVSFSAVLILEKSRIGKLSTESRHVLC